VPTTALIEEEGLTVVFVQRGGETFERRVVAVGLTDGDWTEVRSGVAEGERVVSTGAYAVRLASVSTGGPAHGHAH
jgi:multidrug efflux pump subunit AcrA (membrane-fusion protein)